MDTETKQMLDLILQRLDAIDKNIVEIKEDIAEIKEDTEITRSATNSLVEWAEVTGGFPIKKAE